MERGSQEGVPGPKGSHTPFKQFLCLVPLEVFIPRATDQPEDSTGTRRAFMRRERETGKGPGGGGRGPINFGAGSVGEAKIWKLIPLKLSTPSDSVESLPEPPRVGLFQCQCLG